MTVNEGAFKTPPLQLRVLPKLGGCPEPQGRAETRLPAPGPGRLVARRAASNSRRPRTPSEGEGDSPAATSREAQSSSETRGQGVPR